MIDEHTARQLKKAGIVKDGFRYPKHVGFSFSGNEQWASVKRLDVSDAYGKMFDKVHKILECQVKYDIPIMTVYLLTSSVLQMDHFSEMMSRLSLFFSDLAGSEFLQKNKIKVSILGKWYDLPGNIIDPIKKVLDGTKDFDNFFLNLCINYDGQEEIVDACRLIVRRILAERANVDSIDKQMIKENIYSSYFLPPDLIIRLGRRNLNSFLLWDTTQSIIYFSDTYWQDFSEKDLLQAIKFYQENRR
ncbi:MAG: polyprenyl diphosphate synthase [Candidatus Nanoarchaeia archaeon]